mmetsp:Transcript_1004/g.1636  ORF Transcript_1004/g.1636 Transcript_1004/m.1636 type:complete len:201 (-) Transcript_1004:503-1105(-)
MKRFLACIIRACVPQHLRSFIQWIEHEFGIILEVREKEVRLQLEREMKEERIPSTQNHYLFDNLAKERNKRLMKKLQQVAVKDAYGVEQVTAKAMEAVLMKGQNKSMEESALEEMEMALNAYGKVAAKRVIDNIPKLIDDLLLDGMAGPISEKMNAMTDKDLAGPIRSTAEATDRRRKLEADVEKFDKAIKTYQDILMGY